VPADAVSTALQVLWDPPFGAAQRMRRPMAATISDGARLNYSLVYDARTAPFNFPSGAIFALVLVVLGLVVWRFPHFWFDGQERFGRFFGLLVTGFGGLILVGAPAVAWTGLHSLRDALATHRYTVVEGVVSDFVAGQPDGHPMERFKVAGEIFTYSPFVSPGFNTVSTVGGPLREGLRVRIAVVHGSIARLEIAR
jgi:hypothetical protein